MSRMLTMIEAAKQAGFGGHFAGAALLRARADSLEAQMTALRSAAESAWAAVVRELAAGGEVEPGDVASVGHRHGAWGFDGPAAMAYVQAASACRRDADAAEAAAIPRLFASMQIEITKIVRQSVRLAGDLPHSVRSAHDVIKLRDAQIRHRWADLGDLFSRWRAVHALDELLRDSDLIPRYRCTREDQFAAWLKYEAPERLPVGYGGLAVELQLAAAFNAGAGPGLYDAPTAMARRRGVLPGDMTPQQEMRANSPLPPAPAPMPVIALPGVAAPPVRVVAAADGTPSPSAGEVADSKGRRVTPLALP